MVGGDKSVEVPAALVVAVVVKAFDGRVLDDAVHPLDLAGGPRMVDASEAIFAAMLLVSNSEHFGYVPGCGSVGGVWREAKLDAVVGEHGVDLVQHASGERLEGGGSGMLDACAAPEQFSYGLE